MFCWTPCRSDFNAEESNICSIIWGWILSYDRTAHCQARTPRALIIVCQEFLQADFIDFIDIPLQEQLIRWLFIYYVIMVWGDPKNDTSGHGGMIMIRRGSKPKYDIVWLRRGAEGSNIVCPIIWTAFKALINIYQYGYDMSIVYINDLKLAAEHFGSNSVEVMGTLFQLDKVLQVNIAILGNLSFH